MTNKVPNIRFKGFTDDWEQHKAGEIFKSVSDKGYTDLSLSELDLCGRKDKVRCRKCRYSDQ